MRARIRRVGNSLGILLPKPLLEAWGLGEGDELEVTERGIRPPVRAGFSHQDLDDMRLSLSLAVIRRHTAREIRAKIAANLHRWKQQGSWVSAYDEWHQIMRSEDDGTLFAAMLGRDDDAVRLRQSMPYVGLLSQQEVRKIYEEAAG